MAAARLDRMDRAVAERALRACHGFPESHTTLTHLLERGFAFSSVLGVLMEALAEEGPSGGEEEGEAGERVSFVDAGRNSDAHGVIAAFVLGEPGDRALGDLDPRQALFKRIGRCLYRRQRLAAASDTHAPSVRLFVHPRMHEYVRELVYTARPRQQRGGGGKPQQQVATAACMRGRGKVGSYVFEPEDACLDDVLPPRTPFFCTLLHGAAQKEGRQCGTRAWIKSVLAGSALLKVNEKESETAMELASNAKVHAWLAEKHFAHLSPLHPDLAGVAAYNEKRARAKTMIALRPMTGDVSRARLTVEDIAHVAKTTLIVLHVLHEHDHLHLDIKPKNILYGGEGANREYAVADFGILDPMRDVYEEAVLSDGYRGTYGFMSPLIIRDDSDNEVFRIFRRVAREADQELAAALPDDASVGRLVEKARAEMRARVSRGERLRDVLPKVDLHSLGLTLYDLVRKQPDPEAEPPEAREKLMKFIAGLLFFGPAHFATASQALRALCALFPADTCADVGFGAARP